MACLFQLLRDIDEEFKDNHINTIKRFYLVFESIHTYILDLNQYLDNVEEGIYIQQTLETIFMDPEGKQLLVSLIYFSTLLA